LNTFVQLANYKNFTQTAAKLYIAQSTVTNRIFELEAELGKQLFIRNRKQLQLTPEGEHFLSYAKRILDLENLAIKEIETLNIFQHSIRIGTTNTIYDCHLADKTVVFLTSNPNTKLQITIGHSLPLHQMLVDHAIDIAFTYIPYYKKGFTCIPYKSDNLVLVTGACNTTFLTGITLKQLHTIRYYYCDFTLQDVGSYMKDLFPKGHPFPLEIDRSANLLPYLMNGDGYSFLPESLIQDELACGKLIQIPLKDFNIPEIKSYVTISEQLSNYSCIRDFYDHMVSI